MAAIILLLFCAHGWADTIFLPLTDDAKVNSAPQAKYVNYGTSSDMVVHNWTGKYGLVQFDAASVMGQSISSATLTLYLSSLRESGIMTVGVIVDPWNEATVTWATFIVRGYTELGLPVPQIELRPFDVDGTVSIDVTAFVQRWADGSQPNNGFLLHTSDGIKAYFDTKDRTGGTPAALKVITGQGAPMVTRIPILEGSVVLGDPPRSTFWETTIEIESGAIEAAKTAHIGLYTTNNSLGRLVINGQVVQLPHVELTDNYNQWRPQLGQTLLSIPLGYLQPGANTIRFETGIGNWTPENVYDDYTFGDVEIILSLR